MEISHYDIYNKMVKISVIVPVYNVISCISRCIDSILEQTLTDWELLLIDDGSSDGSALICDDYSSKDKRIKVFHKENGGVSSARNLGIEQASGDWIVFVDSDDWCEPNYLSDFFVENQIGSDSIVLQGIKKESNGVVAKKMVFKDKSYSNIVEGVLENSLLIYGAPYSKLFSKSLIIGNGIRFPQDYSFGEDAVFFFKALSLANKIITTSACNYHYVDAIENSLSKKRHRFEHLSAFLIDSLIFVRIIDEKYKSGGNLVKAYMPNYRSVMVRAITDLYNLNYTNNQKKQCFDKMRNELLVPEMTGLSVSLLRFVPSVILVLFFNIIYKLNKTFGFIRKVNGFIAH